MSAKPNLLVNLPSVIEELTSTLPTSIKAVIADNVGGIVLSAEKLMQLDSIFYMSSLLYPENYQDGGLSDLECFINKLEQEKDERTV